MRPHSGDKVRLNIGPRRGARGKIVRASSSALTVQLDGDGEVIHARSADVTNFSLAARKAWKRMPERRVGRPKGSGTVDRISVVFRVDRELWNRFKEMEASGLLLDRTAAVNSWLSELTRQRGEKNGTKLVD